MVNSISPMYNSSGYEYSPKTARKFLEQFFNVQELKVILHDLGINHENFGATKQVLVIDFLLYVKRHNKVSALIEWLNEEAASFGYDQGDVSKVFRLQDGELLETESASEGKSEKVSAKAEPELRHATGFRNAMLAAFGRGLEVGDIDRAIAECRARTMLSSSLAGIGVVDEHLLVTTCPLCGRSLLTVAITLHVPIAQIQLPKFVSGSDPPQLKDGSL